MCHHTGELCFVIGCEYQAFIHKEETTRQCERVYFIAVDDLDRKRDLCIRMEDNVLADSVDVFGDQRIFDQLGLLLDLESELASQCNFLLLRSAQPSE